MTRTLIKLPNEIIKLCLDSLDKLSDITTSRLACRKLAAIGAPLLWRDGLDVTMTTRSLARLQFISENRDPVFAISVKKITFDLSYYDDEAAENFRMYSWVNTGRIRSKFAQIESDATAPDSEFYSQDRDIFCDIARQIHEEWGNSDLENSKPKALLTVLYDKYCHLYNDQQVAIEQFANIGKIASALQRLTNIRCVRITDKSTDPLWEPEEDEATIWELLNDIIMPIFDKAESSHQRLFGEDAIQTFSRDARPGYEELVRDIIMGRCLHKFQLREEWWPETPGPSRMAPVLVNVFKALARSYTFPTSVELDITPPKHLRMLKIAKEEVRYVRDVAKNARTVDISVTSWARSPTSNQYRTYNEWAYMKRLIGTLCNHSPKLQHLRINLHGYPHADSLPHISAGQFLSLRWEHLQSLDLCSVPFRSDDFVEMIKNLPATLEKLHLNEIYLLPSGTWAYAMRPLRDLRRVDLYFRWPCGGEYGGRGYAEGIDNEELDQTARPVIRESREV